MNKLIALLAISLTGCLSQNKLAKVCAERFPIDVQIKEVIVSDTIIEKETIFKMGFKDSSFTFICPPNKTITIQKEVRIMAENTAKTYLLQSNHQKELKKINVECDKRLDDLNAELKKQTKEIDKITAKYENVKKYKFRFYLLISSILLYFAIRFGIKRIL